METIKRAKIKLAVESENVVLFEWSGEQVVVDRSSTTIIAQSGDDANFVAAGEDSEPIQTYHVPKILTQGERLTKIDSPAPTEQKEWSSVLPLLMKRVRRHEGYREDSSEASLPDDLSNVSHDGAAHPGKDEYTVVVGFDAGDDMTWDRIKKWAESAEEAEKLAKHTGIERAKHQDRGGLAFTYVMHGPGEESSGDPSESSDVVCYECGAEEEEYTIWHRLTADGPGGDQYDWVCDDCFN